LKNKKKVQYFSIRMEAPQRTAMQSNRAAKEFHLHHPTRPDFVAVQMAKFADESSSSRAGRFSLHLSMEVAVYATH
jgi:hypothetical protein